MDIKIKQLDSNFKVELLKPNDEFIAEINPLYLETITKSIVNTDKIGLTIPKYILNEDFKRIKNPIYSLIKHKRIININEKESYVIEEISKEDEKYLKVNAESRETNLKRINLKFEDIGFRLTSSDEENDIYNLNDYMYNETGWKFGYIDDKVKYQTDMKTEKMRWQESVDGYWHDYITTKLAEQFECVVVFDSYNKLINLYYIDNFGGDIKLYLSYDNYMKSLKTQSSSFDIITRLRLIGNEGISLVDWSPTGVDYLENYSYFIDNEDMSKELINALNIYKKMVDERTVEWKKLLDMKREELSKLDDKKMEMLQITANIKALKNMKKVESSQENPSEEILAKYNSEITKLRDEEKITDIAIEDIEKQIEMFESSINEIRILCAKKTATDENGELIFNEKLLNELKNYIFVDSFSDDSYLEMDEMVNIGKRKLEIACKPTMSWDIDITDFTKRIIDNNFRQHFKGSLSLGDIILLWDSDNERETAVFLTEFTKDIKNGELKLTLSNKKVDRSDLIGITNILTDAKETSRLLKSKRYLLINQEKNRMNIPYIKGGVESGITGQQSTI